MIFGKVNDNLRKNVVIVAFKTTPSYQRMFFSLNVKCAGKNMKILVFRVTMLQSAVYQYLLVALIISNIVFWLNRIKLISNPD